MLSSKKAEQLFEQIGIALSALQLQQVQVYTQELIKWNRRINLTRITKEEAIYLQHFGESFCLARFLPIPCRTLLDVGSGAGFPGMALKIFRPELELMMFESSSKKAMFLRELSRALEMREGISILDTRFESWSEKAVGLFDAVTLRGVKMTPALLKEVSAKLRWGGRLLMTTSARQAEEISALNPRFFWTKDGEREVLFHRVFLVGEKCFT